MLGATEKEIQEAVASTIDTRHWSTILNGHSVDFEEFKTEWDRIVAVSYTHLTLPTSDLV